MRLGLKALAGASAPVDQHGQRLAPTQNYFHGFAYDGNNIIFENDLDNSGRIVRNFVYGPGTNEVVAIDQGATTVWQFADLTGTVRTVGFGDNTNGWTIQHRNFDQFGNPIAFPQATIDDTTLASSEVRGDTGATLTAVPRIFAGHQLDRQLGYYDMQARWYDPATGRFLSEDPLGYAAGDANLYRYALGDPVNNVDPDGRIAVYAFWSGVNATLDTAIETGFTYAFGTDEQKANYSIRGTLGKNFAINLATGGLGNKIKWLGRGGQYAFRVAADVLIGTSYDVYANNQDVSTALVSNSLGTAGGEVLGALARRGGRYLARNFQFDTDVLRGAAPTSGFNPFPFRRRAQVGYSQSYAANFDAAFDPAGARAGQLYGHFSIDVAPSIVPLKRGPKIDPNAPHNATIRAHGDLLEAGGNMIVAGGGRLPERLIRIKDGIKTGRRPDILFETATGQLRGRNIGHVDAAGNPVTRELDALRDLNRVIPTDFVPF